MAFRDFMTLSTTSLLLIVAASVTVVGIIVSLPFCWKSCAPPPVAEVRKVPRPPKPSDDSDSSSDDDDDDEEAPPPADATPATDAPALNADAFRDAAGAIPTEDHADHDEPTTPAAAAALPPKPEPEAPAYEPPPEVVPEPLPAAAPEPPPAPPPTSRPPRTLPPIGNGPFAPPMRSAGLGKTRGAYDIGGMRSSTPLAAANLETPASGDLETPAHR